VFTELLPDNVLIKSITVHKELITGTEPVSTKISDERRRGIYSCEEFMNINIEEKKKRIIIKP
jgi:hypothetical protein